MLKYLSVPGIAVSASMILALTSMPLSERERVMWDLPGRKGWRVMSESTGSGVCRGVWEQPVKLPGESI